MYFITNSLRSITQIISNDEVNRSAQFQSSHLFEPFVVQTKNTYSERTENLAWGSIYFNIGAQQWRVVRSCGKREGEGKLAQHQQNKRTDRTDISHRAPSPEEQLQQSHDKHSDIDLVVLLRLAFNLHNLFSL